MALTGVKFASDDVFATNCFPVRYKFGRTSSDASGAWIVAHHAEQKRRFKAILHADHQTYSRMKEECKKTDKTQLASQQNDEVQDDDVKILDKPFLMKLCCVEDPTDLCSVNISNKDLTDVNEDDLLLFGNVAYINAGENCLPFEPLSHFSSLRELEVPLNGLRNLKVSHTDFINLEVLDISYNNLSQDDLLTLGLLIHLKVLHLTGNNFVNLPEDLAMPYLSREKQVRLQRYACLEVLMLDDNKLMDPAVFAALAALPKLRHLDLSKNEIFFIPQLKVVEGRVMTQDGTEKRKIKQPGSSHNGDRTPRTHSLDKQCNTPKINVELMREKSESSAVTTISEVRAENVDNKESSTITTISEVRADKMGDKQEENCLENKELMTEDFNTGDLSARIKDFVSENEKPHLPQQMKSDPKLPPFPELRYLNLSANKIYEEDGLLALAAWPMLEEVDVFNNPLTTENSGDPPMLKRFLQQRLGIKLNRMKPEDRSGYFKKGKTEIRPKYMKITENVPKIPKTSVEEKMMMPLPQPPEHRPIDFKPSYFLRNAQKDSSASSIKLVLPPISTSINEEATEPWAEKETINEDKQINSEYKHENMPDSVFMTQLNDTDNLHSEAMVNKIPFITPEHSTEINPEYDNTNTAAAEVDERYHGYQLLLNIEDLENEPELPPAKDIQGNIRALRHALNHLLVYRDPAVELSKVKKMVQEYRRVPVPPAKPHQTHQEKINEVLTKLKTRSTTEEENLSTVLKNKEKYHKQFPEAKKLLGRIQKRYNTVQYHLIMEAKQAGDIAANVLELFPSEKTK